jgi:hypothetical protein
MSRDFQFGCRTDVYILFLCILILFLFYSTERLTLLFEDRIGSVMEEVIHL